MTVRKFEGEYVQGGTGVLLRYVCTYEFKPIGVVYQVHAAEPGQKSACLVRGVWAWGFWVLRLTRRLRETIHESIDFTDMERFRAKANEA